MSRADGRNVDRAAFSLRPGNPQRRRLRRDSRHPRANVTCVIAGPRGCRACPEHATLTDQDVYRRGATVVIRSKARTNGHTNGHTNDKVGLDDLTGAWNRAGFIAAATPLFESCQRRNAPIAMAYFDFHAPDPAAPAPDNATVDRVLMAMVTLMRKAFRSSDVIGRLEPLRIAVLLTDCTEEALAAVDGVRALTAASDEPRSLTLSAAMVRNPPGGTLNDLMRAADVRTREVRRGN